MSGASWLVLSWLVVAAAPVVEEQQSHDLSLSFDTVEEGTPVSLEFSLRNDTTHPLRIIDHKASCGCVSLAKAPAVIAPGQTGSLICSLNTTGQRGRVLQSIVIKTDRPVQPLYRLELRGTIRAVWTEPQKIEFGTIASEAPPQRSLLIMAAALPGSRIESVEIADRTAFKATVRPAPVGEVHRRAAIHSLGQVDLEWIGKRKAPGAYRTELIVRTNVENARVMRIPLAAHVSGVSRLVPPRLIFGTVRDGDRVTRTCTVQLDVGPNTAALRSLALRADHAFINAQIEAAEAATGTVRMQVIVARSRTSSMPGGLIRGQVTARLGDRIVFSVPYLIFLESEAEGDRTIAPEAEGR